MKKKCFLIFIFLISLAGCSSVNHSTLTESSESKDTESSITLDTEENKDIPQEDVFDENILIDGYWLIYGMSNNEYPIEDAQTFTSASLFKMSNGSGENKSISTQENTYSDSVYSDFEFGETLNNVQVGLGQVSDEVWNGEYSQKVEITAKKIDEDTVFVKQITNYMTITINTYVFKKIDKLTYQQLSHGYKTEAEIIDMIHQTNEMRKNYYHEVEKIYGNETYWLDASPHEFGELGRGNTSEFSKEQKEKFIGLENNEVFPETIFDNDKYNEVYYGLSDIQEYFTVSDEDKKYGVITLISKGGITDASLHEVSPEAKEAKNSIINLLLKITDGKENAVRLKVLDSSENKYLIIQNGKVSFDKINPVKLGY